MHVDDFIYNSNFCQHQYARFVLHYMRLPAVLKMDFAPWLGHHKLYCTYAGERYQVVTASRMGDIGLSKDLGDNARYSIRVDVEQCSEWSGKPTINPNLSVCTNCGEDASAAILSSTEIMFSDRLFCSECCLEQWLDAMHDKVLQKYGGE